jgi:hypothetical protein
MLDDHIRAKLFNAHSLSTVALERSHQSFVNVDKV